MQTQTAGITLRDSVGERAFRPAFTGLLSFVIPSERDRPDSVGDRERESRDLGSLLRAMSTEPNQV